MPNCCGRGRPLLTFEKKSRLGFNGQKYVYSVIDKRLLGITKKWAIAPFVDDQSAISRILGGVSTCIIIVLNVQQRRLYLHYWVK